MRTMDHDERADSHEPPKAIKEKLLLPVQRSRPDRQNDEQAQQPSQEDQEDHEDRDDIPDLDDHGGLHTP